MSNTVKVIDNLSGTLLMETSIEKIQEAYAFATMLEENGVDIKIIAPGLSETLIATLGASPLEIEEYKKSLEAEISSHNDEFGDEFGCALCPPQKS